MKSSVLNLVSGALLLISLVAGLLWAWARDPFQREWWSFKTPDGARFSVVAVMPDRGGPFPVVVWCHGAGGSLAGDGETLRQFASLGMAAVGFEYDQTNQASFDAQFVAVMEAVEAKTEMQSAERGVRNENGRSGDSVRHRTRNPHPQPLSHPMGEGGGGLSPVEAERVGKAESGKEKGEHRTLNIEPRTSNEGGPTPAPSKEGNLQRATLNIQPATQLAWAGNSLGAQRQLSFLARHPERRPVALVRLNGGMVEELRAEGEHRTSNIEHRTSKEGEAANRKSEIVDHKSNQPTPDPSQEGNRQPATFNVQPATALHAWLAHGENDEVFPASDAKAVAEWLRGRGAAVTLDVFPGRGHGFGEDQALLVRRAAEFCARELGATLVVPDNVRASRWYYWLPVGVLALGFGVWRLGRWRRLTKPIAGVVPEAKWSGLTSAATSRWLRWSAAITATTAVLVSAAHLALPLLPANHTTLKLARQWNVRPELRADFDWLVSQPGTAGCRLRDLLDHLNLAVLQRGQFATSLPENEWREFVLSPWLGEAGGSIAWRRELWESLQPRVRRETDAEQAAQIVVRELRKRVSIQAAPAVPSVVGAWTGGKADAACFDRLYVAALRSVGAPSRQANGKVELMVSGRWQLAPRQLLEK